MNEGKTIRDTEVAMMTGRRLSPRQIGAYKEAVRRHYDDGYIEAMSLFYAEAVADVLGADRVYEVMERARELQTKFIDDGQGALDDLIVRVYEKTRVMVCFNDTDEAYVRRLLQERGVKEDDGDDDLRG